VQQHPSNSSNSSNHALAERDACGVGFIFRPQGESSKEAGGEAKGKHRRAIDDALTALARLEHRGAGATDGATGDGAGLMFAIPWALFESEGWRLDVVRDSGRQLAVAVVFLPAARQNECRQKTQSYFESEEFEVIGWRRVPIEIEHLGALALSSCPDIEQVILAYPDHWSDRLANSRLTSARKRLINHLWEQEELKEFYVASASTKTIVYKAMVRSESLPAFYPDLQNQHCQSRWAIFHRRFSTNTNPRWRLAQPFRMLGHNGEINTLLGNRHWIKAREYAIESQSAGVIGQRVQPLVHSDSSDSANLDNVLEFLTNSGNTVEEALMKLIPEAYRNQPELVDKQEIADFYEYHAAFQEPWDGPALVVYSDGNTVGAVLDRNGLRPARYQVLADGTVILGSETGIVDVDQSLVVEKGRLGPGQMINVDLTTGAVSKNWQIKQEVAGRVNYRKLLQNTRRSLIHRPFEEASLLVPSMVTRLQIAAGYGTEDIDYVLKPMATSGSEPVFSMGDDTALACFSSQPRVLYDFFKQRFAQVTNPPIDHLRERLVMNGEVYLRSSDRYSVRLNSPFLNEPELESLAGFGPPFDTARLSLLFDIDSSRLSDVIWRLLEEAACAVKSGKRVLILSDRDVDHEHASIPVLLAAGAVHQHLVLSGLRPDCSIIVETGQCWSVHHFACLLSYGVQAICPYLALESLRLSAERGAGLGTADGAKLTAVQAQANFKKAVEEGLLKAMSKMGISTMSSYIGAQIMECIGLGPQVVAMSFTGTGSPIGGLEIDDIEADVLSLHATAFGGSTELRNYGILKHRKDGELHGNNPAVVEALHGALGFNAKGLQSQSAAHQQFIAYGELVRQRPPHAVRDLLHFRSRQSPIAVEAVEEAQKIVQRFCTGGMSLGALSKEAHEVLAIAMNRMGAKSNSGEGGEDPLRYYPIASITSDGRSSDFPDLKGLRDGDHAGSAIRQVASARFGVTAEYLVTAQQLEIKVAQGAKPGEGGQLPGAKVSPYIARLRRAKPGTTLISPPPHHDIYSIEDLAQLIFDLRQVNPTAKISVKLVSEAGIGTVAAGVAKAGADIIQVSGHDGGTGAAPISSIKHAGCPWELGLAEVHRSLIANGLRHKVILRVDGGLRSGWDIVTAAMLGADEFGFGSIALIAQGCIMARVCHTNNCPVGITTQKEELRKKFRATPDHLVKFFMHIAEEVRHQLAELGCGSLQEVIGRVDLLKQRDTSHVLSRSAVFDLSGLLSPLPAPPRYALRSEPLSAVFAADKLLLDLSFNAAVATHGTYRASTTIGNQDRSAGARVAGMIARRWGDHGFNGKIDLSFAGSAGQSFGAFSVDGMQLNLTGDANDYVGKGMSGGAITLRPPVTAKFSAGDNVIIGNTCLYGATGGALFASGKAGERFAVRNCGANAVIEGAGDHCCEYMTGGTVVVLGETGRNFGAGMTAGRAFVFDKHNSFPSRFNSDCGKVMERVSAEDLPYLKSIIEQHAQLTASVRAHRILKDWQSQVGYFWQVVVPVETPAAEDPQSTVSQDKGANHSQD
jgi:glutamate synthase (ferredoxin)